MPKESARPTRILKNVSALISFLYESRHREYFLFFKIDAEDRYRIVQKFWKVSAWYIYYLYYAWYVYYLKLLHIY